MQAGIVQAFRIKFEADTLLRDGFHARIRSQHIKTQRETSSVARNRCRSDTEALSMPWLTVYNTI